MRATLALNGLTALRENWSDVGNYSYYFKCLANKVLFQVTST